MPGSFFHPDAGWIEVTDQDLERARSAKFGDTLLGLPLVFTDPPKPPKGKNARCARRLKRKWEKKYGI